MFRLQERLKTVNYLYSNNFLCVDLSLISAGNKRFRDIITECIPEYNQANSRLEKSLVVHSIVESVRGEGGRFLKETQSTGEWYGTLLRVSYCSSVT